MLKSIISDIHLTEEDIRKLYDLEDNEDFLPCDEKNVKKLRKLTYQPFFNNKFYSIDPIDILLNYKDFSIKEAIYNFLYKQAETRLYLDRNGLLDNALDNDSDSDNSNSDSDDSNSDSDDSNSDSDDSTSNVSASDASTLDASTLDASASDAGDVSALDASTLAVFTLDASASNLVLDNDAATKRFRQRRSLKKKLTGLSIKINTIAANLNFKLN